MTRGIYGSQLEREFEAALGVSLTRLHRRAATVFRRFGMRASRERCDEAVQEWVLLVLQAGEAGGDRVASYRWMMRACGGLALRGKRRMISLDRAIAVSIHSTNDDCEAADCATIGALVEKLDQRRRTLIHAHYFLGCSYRQIAAATGVRASTARALVQSARRTLAARLRSAVRAGDRPSVFRARTGAAS